MPGIRWPQRKTPMIFPKPALEHFQDFTYIIQQLTEEEYTMPQSATPCRLAFTLGDPNGVGPEVFLKAFSEITKLCCPVVIGERGTLEYYGQKLGLTVPDCEYMDKGYYGREPQPGKLSAAAGAASARYVICAIEEAMLGAVDGMVTLPINKEAINLGGYHYAGHTEMLGEYTGVTSQSMMLVAGNIRVVLVTTHVALESVPALLNRPRIMQAMENAYRGMIEIGIALPRVAVCALNPHASDGGVFGSQEEQIILPAIREYDSTHGTSTAGPLPADSLFARMAAGNEFDVAVCMYHDQGMIPVKMAGFGGGVNITMGLPIVRTSVDHGTAFGIAGKGQASSTSLVEATRCAVRILEHRRSYGGKA